MRPWAAMPSLIARDPAMLKWSGLLVWLGGGCQPHFSEDFFSRLDQDIMVMDYYGYAGIDFCHDPDFVLPMGEDWDASLGMLWSLFFSYFWCFSIFYIFFWCLTQCLFVLYRSRAITTGRDVAVSTEGCFIGRCCSERHRRRVWHRPRRGGGIIDSVDDFCSPHQGWRYPCPYAPSCQWWQ